MKPSGSFPLPVPGGVRSSTARGQPQPGDRQPGSSSPVRASDFVPAPRVGHAQSLLKGASDRKAFEPRSPGTPRGPVVFHDLKGMKPAELSRIDLYNVRANRSGAGQLLAQFMYRNPDMTLASKLVQQGAQALSFDALLTDEDQVVIPDCPLWVARGLDGGDPPCFPAAVLGGMTAGGACTGLLIQVGTPPDKLHWGDAFVTRALDTKASMVLIPREKIAAFGLLAPSRGSFTT